MVKGRFTGSSGHKAKCEVDPENRRSFPDENHPGVPFALLFESVLHCFSRAHQYTFQCQRSACEDKHEEMFLYNLLGEEDQIKALLNVVKHLEEEFKMVDWIEALRVLEPLQKFYMKLKV